MQIKQVPLDSISQDPANVRKHNERNIDAIVASLRAFGQQTPIVVDARGVILKGNGTYEAARKLGWENIGVVFTELSGSSATAYAIADNRTSELGEWDLPALGKQLESLETEGFNIETLAFDETYLAFASDLNADDPETVDELNGPKGESTLDEYNARTIRQIVLFYEFEQFELIIDALGVVMEKNSLSTNSEAVAFLIEQAGYSVQPRLEDEN